MSSFDTFIPLTPGSAPTSALRTIVPKILTNDFSSGGYAQRRPNGRNTMLASMKLVFASITLAEARDMISFFEDKGGYKAFLYTAPGDSQPKKWIATEWSKTPNVPDYDVIATFQEVVDP